MSRACRLGRLFAASVTRAGIVSRSEQALALDATMSAICAAIDLPGPDDLLVVVPPALVTYVRRVRSIRTPPTSSNVWVHFVVKPDRVVFTYIVTTPPIPASPFVEDE